MQMNKMSEDEPAGFRNPKPFKKTYEDKIPEWIQLCRTEGKKDDEIAQLLFEKERKYVNKWGNRSQIGGLMNPAMDDAELAETVKVRKRSPLMDQAKRRADSLPAISDENQRRQSI